MASASDSQFSKHKARFIVNLRWFIKMAINYLLLSKGRLVMIWTENLSKHTAYYKISPNASRLRKRWGKVKQYRLKWLQISAMWSSLLIGTESTGTKARTLRNGLAGDLKSLLVKVCGKMCIPGIWIPHRKYFALSWANLTLLAQRNVATGVRTVAING